MPRKPKPLQPLQPLARLRELLSYNPKTDQLWWKVNLGKVRAGRVAYAAALLHEKLHGDFANHGEHPPTLFKALRVSRPDIP